MFYEAACNWERVPGPRWGEPLLRAHQEEPCQYGDPGYGDPFRVVFINPSRFFMLAPRRGAGPGGIFSLSKASTATVLGELNQRFLDSHHHSRHASLAQVNHVLVYHLGELSFWNKAEDGFYQLGCQQLLQVGDAYDQLKKVVHVPVYLQTLLLMSGEPDKLKLLQLKLCLDHLLLQPEFQSQSEAAAHQRSLLLKTKALLDLALRSPPDPALYREGVNRLFLDLKGELAYLRQRATELQLERLQTKVEEGIRNYRMDLRRCRVLVTGPHGPREGLIEVQYFERLFQEKLGLRSALNDRVYYSESLPAQLKKIDIKRDLIEGFLANAEVNKSIGVSYAHDKKALFSDVLARSAPLALAGLFKKPRGCPMKAGVGLLKASLGLQKR